MVDGWIFGFLGGRGYAAVEIFNCIAVRCISLNGWVNPSVYISILWLLNQPNGLKRLLIGFFYFVKIKNPLYLFFTIVLI